MKILVDNFTYGVRNCRDRVIRITGPDGIVLQEDMYRGDGLNLYAYCVNTPVMYYDLSGYARLCVNGKDGLDPAVKALIQNPHGDFVTEKDGSNNY